jgi:hypothetical protein
VSKRENNGEDMIMVSFIEHKGTSVALEIKKTETVGNAKQILQKRINLNNTSLLFGGLFLILFLFLFF